MAQARWKMPTKRPSRKLVVGGISGLTLGQALAEIVAYAIETGTHQPLPLAIHGAITTVLVVAAFAIVGYLTPPSGRDVPVPDVP